MRCGSAFSIVSLLLSSHIGHIGSYRFISMKGRSKGLMKNVIKDSLSAVASSSSNYLPRSVNQKLYVDALSNHSIPIVIGAGSAGTGKTLFACQAAVMAFKKGEVSKIVMTRPLVSVDQEPMGFLPGTLEKKMSPWTRPMFDLLEEFYSHSQIVRMMEDGIIEIAPLAYMRGRTFRNSFIIADEVQNISPSQMFMLLTRLGEGSRIAITGDLKQSDFSGKNGLVDFVEKVGERECSSEICLIQLGEGDIQRSPIVQQIVSMYSSIKNPITTHVISSPVNMSNEISYNNSNTTYNQFYAPCSLVTDIKPIYEVANEKWCDNKTESPAPSKKERKKNDKKRFIEDLDENDCALIPKHLDKKWGRK